MIKMYNGLHVKKNVILVGFERNLDFFDKFSKNTQISNLMKIGPVAAEPFHAKGQTR